MGLGYGCMTKDENIDYGVMFFFLFFSFFFRSPPVWFTIIILETQEENIKEEGELVLWAFRDFNFFKDTLNILAFHLG